jgi:hypothetical protein
MSMHSSNVPGNRVIYAADVGSTRSDGQGRRSSGFGWARQSSTGTIEGDSSIEYLARCLCTDLAAGRRVALGVEAPAFVPVPSSADRLCRGRAGEGNRSCASQMGLAVTALGLHQAAWILDRVRVELGQGGHDRLPRFSQRPDDWLSPTPIFFCWEAFVSGEAHSDDHIRDAATAVVGFAAAEHDLGSATSVSAERPLSVLGAAALWSGWTNDLAELHETTVVIRPRHRYEGVIGSVSAGVTVIDA